MLVGGITMKRFLRKRLIWAWAIIGACLIIALPGVLAATAAPSHGAVGVRDGSMRRPSTQPTGGLRPGTQFTPVIASTLTTPEPVRGSDGRIHLAYELLLTNATAFSIRISQVEVLGHA
jgi:hypothetical protein